MEKAQLILNELLDYSSTLEKVWLHRKLLELDKELKTPNNK